MSSDKVRPGGERKVLTVSQLTRQVRESLESRFPEIWIEGEISNYRAHGSGHHYFTLKDESAQVSCVLFRGQARFLRFSPSDGQQVRARGAVSVYEARGQYQLIVQSMQPAGIGNLQARFEKLKRKLEIEGLFEPGRKKPIPAFPGMVAVITSPSGAALRDILQVLRRRGPWVDVVVFPVRVQGVGADREIADGIRRLSEWPDQFPAIDLAIVGRGGGGIEDLWSFNEETVARAISECPVPLISAVGHEIDFTIADFVADVRAPTPSAAAELAIPDGVELRDRLEEMRRRSGEKLRARIEVCGERLALTRRTLIAHEPRIVLESALQSVDYLSDRMTGATAGILEREGVRLFQAERALDAWRPELRLAGWEERVLASKRRLDKAIDLGRREITEKVSVLAARLKGLSPEGIFRRGFSLTLDADGNPLTDATLLETGDRVKTRLAKGEFESVVE